MDPWHPFINSGMHACNHLSCSSAAALGDAGHRAIDPLHAISSPGLSCATKVASAGALSPAVSRVVE